MKKFVRVIILLAIFGGVLIYFPLVEAGLGSPKLSVYVDVSPSTTLQWGDSATLTVTVKETGGEDWANDVTVSVLVPQGSKISITPSKSEPRDIDKGASASFTFTVRVPEYEEPGTKKLTIIVEYGDTGWLDMGETRYTIIKYVYLTVKKPPAKLIVRTTPSQAKVYINGVYKGLTPLTITLEEGTYDLKIEKEGYETIQEVVTLYPGKTTTISRELKSLPLVSKIKTGASGVVSEGDNNFLMILGVGLIMILVLVVGISKIKKPKEGKDDSSKTIATKAKQLFPSELLKKYEPLEFIGEGGFAKVFKVKRKSDGKIVAVKIPRIDEKISKVFLREVGTWLHLDHPNIVKLYEADILPVPHLEMEYVEGVNLNGKTIRSLEEYPKPVDEELALRFVKGVTQAVKYAHSQNVLHRDIKPLNVLLKHNFTPKLTDWGLSKIGVTTSSKTATGYTPLYATPEQLLPSQYGHTDHRTDLYQIGAVLYELLTGQPPYEGHSQAELIGKITDPNYLPKRPSEFNPELYIFDKFFKKALAKRKEDRFQSADELLQALKELEKVVRKRKELKKTVAELKKDLNRSKLELKKSRSAEEAKLKTLEILDLYQKLAMLYCELNSQSELLELLGSLKYYVKSEELKKDVEAAREYLKYYINEDIPIGNEFAQRLNELISHIKMEVKEENA
ncbi:protein kinase domain-containing protein [Thermococcus barophilus]|uniref:non-specific serine/threonine protein kinase n=1 Tax=Thermococcus barophilus TaxID=55802 RepID=A0A0S1XCL8_THEBA|nr:protein kinase [Thermococcus barophilus]ALM75537.1 Serine/threonine protein kinase [Thermococcus barophilus]